MKTIRCLLFIAFCGIGWACQKGKDDGSQQTSRKTYLKRIIYGDSSTKYFSLFQYDSNGKVVKYFWDSIGKPGILNTEFYYNGQNRLSETKVYANNGSTVSEIRKYYYDANGYCIGDTAFDVQGRKTWYWDNSYSYDSDGRLLTVKHQNETVIRYEYGANKNPTKSYIKSQGQPELAKTIYSIFDNKKSWLGDCKELRHYFLVYGHKYAFDFFENNAIEYKELWSRTTGTTNGEWSNMKEELIYNASGYPIKRKVIQTNSGGTNVVWQEEYEFEEK